MPSVKDQSVLITDRRTPAGGSAGMGGGLSPHPPSQPPLRAGTILVAFEATSERIPMNPDVGK